MNTVSRWVWMLLLTNAAPASAATLGVGDWSLTLPAYCDGSAHVSYVDATPLYSAEDAAALANDPLRVLKPDYANMPAHWRVDLSACLGKADQGFATELLILPVADYLGIYAADRQPEAGMHKAFDALKTWNATLAAASDWPFIPFVDMSPIAVLGSKRLHSADVAGARVLTQFTPDVGFLQSGALTYIYQGLSHDGQCYVLMTVPLRAEGLAADGDDRHWGFTLNALDADPDQKSGYATAARTWLLKHRDSIEPALSLLDTIASSIVRRAH